MPKIFNEAVDLGGMNLESRIQKAEIGVDLTKDWNKNPGAGGPQEITPQDLYNNAMARLEYHYLSDAQRGETMINPVMANIMFNRYNPDSKVPLIPKAKETLKIIKDACVKGAKTINAHRYKDTFGQAVNISIDHVFSGVDSEILVNFKRYIERMAAKANERSVPLKQPINIETALKEDHLISTGQLMDAVISQSNDNTLKEAWHKKAFNEATKEIFTKIFKEATTQVNLLNSGKGTNLTNTDSVSRGLKTLQSISSAVGFTSGANFFEKKFKEHETHKAALALKQTMHEELESYALKNKDSNIRTTTVNQLTQRQ